MNPVRYVAFGDSITEGYGVIENFVSILSQKLAQAYPSQDLETINTGMSGDNSRDGLHRLKHDVLLRKPDLVTVNFGVNDAFSGIPITQFALNLEQMAGLIADAGCGRIVFLSSEVIPEPWAEEQVRPYWDTMKGVAGRTRSAYADVHGRWLREIETGRRETELIIPGGMHPNEEGHRVIAEAVFEAIQENGLLEGV